VNALYRFLDEYGQPATRRWPADANTRRSAQLLREFVILGDPSLLLPQPNGFRLEASPESQAICVPSGYWRLFVRHQY